MSMSSSKGKSQTDPSSVWGGQSGALQNLYGQGSNLANQQAPQLQQMASQNAGMVNPMVQQGMQALANPQTYARTVQQQWQPMVQQGIQAMNLGGSRQGVAQAEIANSGMTNWLGNLGQAGNLMNLGMQPYQQQWMPYQNLSGILGSPTVLSGASWAKNMSFSGGLK